MTRRAGRLGAIFDCNTLIQAIAFDGPAAACIILVENGVVELFVSRATLAEVRSVLADPRVREISVNMTPLRTAAFVQRLIYRTVLVRRVPKVFVYSRDPKDEPYINLAVATEADYLVTYDKDLLSLKSGHSLVCKQFRRLTHPLRVVEPADFLDAVRRSKAN